MNQGLRVFSKSKPVESRVSTGKPTFRKDDSFLTKIFLSEFLFDFLGALKIRLGRAPAI